MMTLWRIWHCRNEVVHNKPAPPIEASRRFLGNYIESLLSIQQHPRADHSKGKFVITCNQSSGRSPPQALPKPAARTPLRWTPPPAGWSKLNVAGAFAEATATGGAGMILRDDTGKVIFSCRHLFACSSALEAELAACVEGAALAMEWSQAPFILETDSSVAASLIGAKEIDRSPLAALVNEVKRILSGDRLTRVAAIRREQNGAGHMLAQIGHRMIRTDVWLTSGPEGVVKLCASECNEPP